MADRIIHTDDGRKLKVIVSSPLLSIALLEWLDDDGLPTGRRAMADPNKFRTVTVTDADIPY